jgi:hypothetical protein
MPNRFMKQTILLIIAVVAFGCANHREARRKSVQLYPGLAQREVVNLFGMPSKAEGNPDEGIPSGDYLIWEYENVDLKISFRLAQAGRVVKTWSID